MIISLQCSAGHFSLSQNILVLWLHSNPESGYPRLIVLCWADAVLAAFCNNERHFLCNVHYLWALNFAWHHVHPSGKCFCLTNLNNCAPFGNVAASLNNSLSRSSVPVFKDSSSTGRVSLPPLAIRKIDNSLSYHRFLIFRSFLLHGSTWSHSLGSVCVFRHEHLSKSRIESLGRWAGEYCLIH